MTPRRERIERVPLVLRSVVLIPVGAVALVSIAGIAALGFVLAGAGAVFDVLGAKPVEDFAEKATK